MPVFAQFLLQGAVGVGCIVLAVVFLPPSKPEYLAAYTAVSGFGFACLGNMKAGPNQVALTPEVRDAIKSIPPNGK